MLTDLAIRNYAIVDQLDIELRSGMTCVTGETGAGKSIMLDALGLCLGDRADSRTVRSGSDKTEVSALFALENLPQVKAWLDDAGLGNDDECLIRRVVTSDGRSRAFINGSPATLAQCSELGTMLVDLHSQHAHQSLLRKPTQQAVVDDYAGTTARAEEVARLAGEIRALRADIAAREAASKDINERRELLNYQVQELEELNPIEGELPELEADHKQLTNASWIIETLHGLSEQCAALGDQLRSSVTTLNDERLGDRIKDSRDLVTSSQIQLEEAASEMRRHLDTVELDPAKLSAVEDRLTALHELARKHRVPADYLASHLTALSDELFTMDQGDDLLESLRSDLATKINEWQDLARALSSDRQSGADKLAKRTMELLAKLAMDKCLVEISFAPLADDAIDPRGLEALEILIATNPGSQPGPLNKVASGGELSRISLALQVAVADKATAPTMIFDEVDVGVGGAVADVVGGLLRTLSENVQVLCVTHLPQVAAKGTSHIEVSKAGDAVTTTQLRYLSDQERVEELSRMLGGAVVTDKTRDNARELLAAS